jgi:hypothetical protein
MITGLTSRFAKAVALVFAVALAMSCGTASADLVTNGDFETGDFTGWTVNPNPGYNFVYVSGNGLVDQVTINANTGSYFAALGYNTGITGIGTVSQTLSTTPGQLYRVSFAYLAEGPSQPGTSPDNSFSASFGTDTLFSAFNDNTIGATATNWVPESFLVTATSSSTVLSFTSYNNPYYDALDSVSVVAVPEPSSLVALCGLGMAGLFLVVRRRR